MPKPSAASQNATDCGANSFSGPPESTGLERAYERMSDRAKENLPDVVLDRIDAPYHYATTGSDTFTGRAGEVDVFIFDTNLANTDPEGVDRIIGFEQDLDQVIYSNWGDGDLLAKSSKPTAPTAENPIADLYGAYSTDIGGDRRTNLIEYVDFGTQQVTFSPQLLAGEFVA